MKKFILAAICTTMLIAFGQRTQAQVRVSINIGAQPDWGPVGYDYTEYYYLPDIDAYYWVPQHQFIYLSNGRWVFAASLPPRHRGYDLYSGYKVVINEPRPYLHHERYRERYEGYRGHHDQVVIRDSDDPKYHHDNGHHYGWSKHGRGKGHDREGDRD